jgi:cobalt/nickel transport system permease protein
VGAGHAHSPAAGLYVEGSSPLHRARPQCKLAATVLFVLAVVATPREAFWAYGLYAAVLAGLGALARVPARLLASRFLVEIPFVIFAVLLPFVGQGERVQVLGRALSVDGLWAMWNILVKATLGLAATVILAATTPLPEILRGLERLRVPSVFTTIAGFMVRYADVITGELSRMRVARMSRGYDPRWVWQAKAVATSAGALFIRSYERGERVYLAMVSRGWTGAMPAREELAASPRQWAAALAAPAFAAVVAIAAWALPR